jgi:hypothetical protein
MPQKFCRSLQRSAEAYNGLPKLTMRRRSFDELPKPTMLCRSFDGLPKDRQPAEANNGLPKLRRVAEASMRWRSFDAPPKLRQPVEASVGKGWGLPGFERCGTIARRAGDRGGGAGSGRSGAGCPSGRPLRRSRLQSADGKEREREARWRLAEAAAGIRLVEPAAEESPALGDEAEGRLRPEASANAANAANDRREPEAERLDGGKEGLEDQERGEERRQGASRSAAIVSRAIGVSPGSGFWRSSQDMSIIYEGCSIVNG